MFLCVLLTLFSEWIWVDETEKISMGFEFTSGKVAFADLDGDGDVDMLRAIPLEAYENVLDEGGRLWINNPDLIEGIDVSGFHSLAAANLNGSGTDEVITDNDAYIKVGTVWEKDDTFFDDLYPAVWVPDFADVDGDGDLDMIGGWGHNEYDITLGMWWNIGSSTNPEWEFDSTCFLDGEIPADMMRFARWIDWRGDGEMDVLFVQWFYDYDWCQVYVFTNQGTWAEPEWVIEPVFETTMLDDFAVVDWNSDGIDDVVLVDYSMHPEAYLYVPGEPADDSIAYDFDHPYLWGGLFANDLAVADVNADGNPELSVIKYEYHWEFEIPYPKEYFLPHLKHYSFSSGDYCLWRRTDETAFWSLAPTDSDDFVGDPADFKYVDFLNDGLVDYVLNLNGDEVLYRNQGTPEEPSWVRDDEALEDLPAHFPSCYFDIDGDADKDVIAVVEGDSVFSGFRNIGSDSRPQYLKDNDLLTGLEELETPSIASGDLNDDGLIDLVSNHNMWTFFNTGKDNPRWSRHEEVFKSLGTSGVPALADADQDGDLDLYLVSDGRVRYYRNESTGAILERPDANEVEVRLTRFGHQVELVFAVPETCPCVYFSLYNPLGQKVAEYREVPAAGKVHFRLTERVGVYFYKARAGERTYPGKVVIY